MNSASFVGTAVPFPLGAVYGATKAAVLSLTASTAAGYGEHGIRIYAVCPWITDTPMIDRLTGHQPEAKQELAAMNPSGHIATPDEIAEIVVSMFTGDADVDPGEAVLIDHGGRLQKIGFSVDESVPAA